MCVILALETQKELDSLTLEILLSAESMNPDGNGYATLKDGKVIFNKGVTVQDIWSKIQSGEIISPCVLHFRITSAGKTIPELCHPFIVNEDSRNYMNGTIDDNETALFHNGTIDYKDLVLSTAMGSGRQLPKGEMSDTRGIAFVLQTLGNSALNYIDTGFNKFATLNAKEGLVKYGNWVNVNGIQSSNNYYDSISTQYNNFGTFPKNNHFAYDEFNDEDTIMYSREAKEPEITPSYDMDKAQTAITEFKGKALLDSKTLESSNAFLDSKVTKKEHKMNVKYLKQHGWQSFKSYSKKEIQRIVNSMQQQKKIITEIKKTKKELSDFEKSYDSDDYQDVWNYQNSMYP